MLNQHWKFHQRKWRSNQQNYDFTIIFQWIWEFFEYSDSFRAYHTILMDAFPYPRCQLIVKAIIRGPYGPISKHVIMLMDLWWHMVTIYQNSSGFTHSMPWLHQVGSRPHFHASLHTTSKHSLIYAWLSHHACLSHTLTVPNMRKIMLTNKHL